MQYCRSYNCFYFIYSFIFFFKETLLISLYENLNEDTRGATYLNNTFYDTTKTEIKYNMFLCKWS